MPKDKAQLMRETRQRRRDQGLIPFEAWVTPEHKKILQQTLKELNNGK